LTVSDLVALLVRLSLVVFGADVPLDGLLALLRRWRRSAFALVVLLAEPAPENLAAGVAGNIEGASGAVLGTCLGSSVVIALGLAGLGGMLAPSSVSPARSTVAWTTAAPLPLLLLSLDGEIGHLHGLLLLFWFAVAIGGLPRGEGTPPQVDENEAEDRRGPVDCTRC
jgi:Ca2+/Na+ antiporter